MTRFSFVYCYYDAMVAMVANFSRLIFITLIICKNFNLCCWNFCAVKITQFLKHLFCGASAGVCLQLFMEVRGDIFTLTQILYSWQFFWYEDAFPRLAVNKKLYESCTWGNAAVNPSFKSLLASTALFTHASCTLITFEWQLNSRRDSRSAFAYSN